MSSHDIIPRIEILTEKKLVGKCLEMTFAENKTAELWKGFMPRRNEIKNRLNNDFISMQVYDASFDFNNFNPHKTFTKCAAVEVTDFDKLPEEMETFTLREGLYAVFAYTGLNTDTTIFEYIYGTWISNSNYALDNRPHFERLGAKYKNGDPNSEEEIWIPIKMK